MIASFFWFIVACLLMVPLIYAGLAILFLTIAVCVVLYNVFWIGPFVLREMFTNKK